MNEFLQFIESEKLSLSWVGVTSFKDSCIVTFNNSSCVTVYIAELLVTSVMVTEFKLQCLQAVFVPCFTSASLVHPVAVQLCFCF
jgi:hypothetical protein